MSMLGWNKPDFTPQAFGDRYSPALALIAGDKILFGKWRSDDKWVACNVDGSLIGPVGGGDAELTYLVPDWWTELPDV